MVVAGTGGLKPKVGDQKLESWGHWKVVKVGVMKVGVRSCLLPDRAARVGE